MIIGNLLQLTNRREGKMIIPQVLVKWHPLPQSGQVSFTIPLGKQAAATQAAQPMSNNSEANTYAPN
jgi:hypothetical protein